MATFADVLRKIDQLKENVRQRAPQIVAETATEYYKERFREKEWDDNPWPQVKHPNPRGSLMVRSGALLSTIRPSTITHNEVVISAGNARVPYARIHNEGGTITQIPTAKQRRFFWAMEYKTNPGKASVANGSRWAKMAISKEMTIPIPRRQFMGRSQELNRRIIERLAPLITEPFK